MEINKFSTEDLLKIFSEMPKEADVIVVAGDIESPKFIRELASHFKDKLILYILGNHDYYRNSLEDHKYLSQWENKVNKQNAHLLNRSTYKIDNTIFLGLTLWSKAVYYPEQVSRISCFRKISFPPQVNEVEITNKLDSAMMADVHNYEKSILFNSFLKLSHSEKLIPITHFCPRDEFIKPHWLGNNRNEYFSANMGEWITSWRLTEKIPLWMFGHMHDASDETIDSTRYICNPYGTFDEIGKNGRKTDLIVEV